MLGRITFFAFVCAVCILPLGCPPVDEGTVYFLVADVQHPENGGYILPLADPADIAHARALIWNPNGTDLPLVVARIAPGGSEGEYANRDLMGDGALWSWRIVEFLEFADVTAEVLDGNARIVEDDLDAWIANTNSAIGFWSYRVIRRVWPYEMAAE